MPSDSPGNDRVAHRQIARLSGEVYLKFAQILTEGLNVDLVAGVIFLTISRLNLIQMMADQERAVKYAGVEFPLPDEEREPISVYAVSREIGLPYETVRRHANKLVKLRHCDRVEGGGMIISPHYRECGLAARMGDLTLATVVDFVRDIGASGLSVPATAPRPPDVRLHVGRLSGRYFLSLQDRLSKGLNLELLAGLVLMAIITANTQELRRNQRLAQEFGAMDDVPPDGMRQAVSVYAVSKTLHLPYETARRYVAALIEAGYCVRMPGGGVVVPGRVQFETGFMKMMMSNREAVDTFLVELAAVGVTAAVLSA